MAMVPHERSLVKRLAGKPFALLGINMDRSKDVLQKSQKDNEITWRSWFDGQSGPIAKLYNIQFLPTIYILDAKGVIRYKGVRGEQMDEAVDALLGELQKK
jgi:hypothetical protein